MATQQWRPQIAVTNILSIVEECECVCDVKTSSDGRSCCSGGDETTEEQCIKEFDGIEDILAVSSHKHLHKEVESQAEGRTDNHVTDRSIAKKKPPLLRARTLPAIITPSLSIIQAQLDANHHVVSPQQEFPPGEKLSPRSRRSPSTDKHRSSQDGIKWNLLMVEDDEGSSVSKSPSVSPRLSVSSISSTSSQHGLKESKKSEQSGSRASLAKLARLLISKDKSPSNEKTSPIPTFSNNQSEVGAPTCTGLRKASSIDSLLDAASHQGSDDQPPMQPSPLPRGSLTLAVPTNGKIIPLSPSVPAKLEMNKRGAIPSSPSVPNKLANKSNIPTIRQQGSQGSIEILLDTIPLSKAEKKKLEKWNKFNIDLQALFISVEHGLVERAQSILDSSDIDINSVNADGFSPLDIAVMTNNVPMVKLLQCYGAKESTRFLTKESRASQLGSLVKEAERCVQNLASCVKNAATNGTLSAALLKEKERQLTLWERRHQLLIRMKSGFDSLRTPDPPKSVQLEVVGTRSLKVKFMEAETANDPESIVTKYKVQWSCYEDFNPQAGSTEIDNLQKLEVTIPDLTQGTTYFVRVCSGNVKGYSSYQIASPLSAIPSTWKDVDGKKPRSAGRLRKLEDLFHQLINSHTASEIKVAADLSDTPQQQRRQVRKSIKNLFTAAPKFHKTMKRGVFLACLLYNEDRVLVTTEETLPVIEVDETYPSSLHTDFHWMMKVACTWEDVKSLRQDMEKSHSASNVHFRSKLLQAVEQMQTALGLQDIGRLYYKPLKDGEGTTVLCTVKYIPDPKSLNSLSIRWLPLTKIQRKFSIGEGGEQVTAGEMLVSSLQEMITYNQVSFIPLPRGLYLGYVKLKSSVDLIRVLVPLCTPNVLPHCRIRENPHVSCGEWKWLKQQILQEGDRDTPTELQLKFQKVVSSAAHTLLSHLETPEEQYDNHRIFDAEVIELSPDVSFVLLLPPIENVCSVPGQTDELTSRLDFVPLPVQIFEMNHMGTYQPNFIAKYSRLSSILEMDHMVAQHAQREAFSSTEVVSAKSRLGHLQEFQLQVDNTWRGMRWIMDVLTFARDKQANGGIPLSQIFTKSDSSSDSSPAQSPVLLQVPGRQERRLSREEIDRNFLWIATLETGGDNKLGSPIEIRRCASTSRLLQVTGRNENDSDDPSSCEFQKSSNSERTSEGLESDNDENITITTTNFDDPDEPDCIDFMTNACPGSSNWDGSLTGSNPSLSSRDIPQDDDESESVSLYSKDSACSLDDKQHLPTFHIVEHRDDACMSSSLSSTSNGSECPPNVIRVYSDYESGLPRGTSVKLQVSLHTTAREIVQLVVKQLNTAVILKGREGPIYGNNQLENFCLVAANGPEEWVLDEEFQILNLHQPWTRGKLFVRQKEDALCEAQADM